MPPIFLHVAAGTSLGTYEIIELLGKGGMGEVWRAHDKKLKREVAIKLLPDEFPKDRVFNARPRVSHYLTIPISPASII